jgi:hypothetical protein
MDGGNQCFCYVGWFGGVRPIRATGGVKTGRGCPSQDAGTIAEQRPWQRGHVGGLLKGSLKMLSAVWGGASETVRRDTSKRHILGKISESAARVNSDTPTLNVSVAGRNNLQPNIATGSGHSSSLNCRSDNFNFTAVSLPPFYFTSLTF